MDKDLHRWLVLLVLLIQIGGAIVRSSLATRLDSFTIDEAYHIGAGVAYVRTGDFRLNPEHPPLVKLWTGAFVASQGFKLSPYHEFLDKNEEREFAETDVYRNNELDLVQRRARTAMFALNGLLLLAFSLAVWRVLGPLMSLAATVFLVIDPTVAAHFPVVMTDLPVALLSTTAVLLAVAAFRSWRAVDLILAAIALGMALGSKHSAILTLAAVALIGLGMALFRTQDVPASARLRRVGAVAVVLVGAVIVLWGFYRFRFSESPATSAEQLNRPLVLKIGDVHSPLYRAGLTVMAKGHLFPRAYIWGLADTIRAGAEGRAISVLAFGRLYYNRAPFYYFPGVLAVKLPLGLLALTLLGAGLWILRRTPPAWDPPLIGILVLAALFLLALATGSSYAGIRHALPVVPPLALVGSLAIDQAVRSRSLFLRGAVAVALAGALLSALPVLRPWEYFNETVGGTANGHLYFNDEGVDLGLRTKELAAYYEKYLKPKGELPILYYASPRLELISRGVDWMGRDLQRDAARMHGATLSGTFFVGNKEIAPTLWWDFGKQMRAATPVARFGNLLVVRGTFPASPAAQAFRLFLRAAHDKIYTERPDLEGGIEMLSQSIALDPSAFFVSLELGNQYLKLGKRNEALRAYQMAHDHAPASDDIRELLEHQIGRVRSEPLAQIQPLRNPGLE